MADEMLMTALVSWTSRCGVASWVRLNAVVTFHSNALVKARSLVSRKAAGMSGRDTVARMSDPFR